jgi:cytochrome c oxidase cbb3-type subunit 3
MLKKLMVSIIVLIGLSQNVRAESSLVAGLQDVEWLSSIMDILLENIVVFLAGLIILFALLVMYRTLMVVLEHEKQKAYEEAGIEIQDPSTVERGPSLYSQLMDKLTAAVPVSREKEVDLGHDFDGIRELDNRLPPWWLGLFYGSILFAFVYIYYYHFSGNEWSSRGEYEEEVAAAERAARIYRMQQADVVDEENVQFLTDELALEQGEVVFQSNCATCHGEKGEGGVGPNLTDPYWLHGGTINDVFSVIKYGVPEKGMVSWQAQIRPSAMEKVASFIMTLQGTEPPGGKEREGEYHDPEIITRAEIEEG